MTFPLENHWQNPKTRIKASRNISFTQLCFFKPDAFSVNTINIKQYCSCIKAFKKAF